MDKRNLVLTGFMGTGKTCVGRLVAAQLQREFVDMDEWIAAREGASIAEIFEQRGEAYFRERESELCVKLARRENLVIATGGGSLVNPLNFSLFSEATVVCLDAPAEEIVRRLDGSNHRPLLNSKNGSPVDQVSGLLAARSEAYGRIALHVDTSGRTIQEVTHAVIEIIQNTRISCPLQVRTPDGSYPIHLERGLLDRVGEILARADLAARAAIVTNPTVGRLYASRVTESLRAGGFEPIVIEIPDGEGYKNLETLQQLYDQFAQVRLERRSPVLALGGGVIGDIAGFAAATFMRGVPFVQIPTTLLAMVDASIGGKVAVNHPAGKNLIGAFKFPYAVIADPDAHDTLPAEELQSGMAEVVKHGIIGDAGLFDALFHRSLEQDLIRRAIRVKIELVERDPYEANVRAHLNLGHTFGHALEKLSGYTMRHGYAVAAGIAVAARLAVRLGLCDSGTRDRILELLQHLTLPSSLPTEFSNAELLTAMGTDKKIRDGSLRLVLPRAIGQVELVSNVPTEAITAAFDESRTI